MVQFHFLERAVVPDSSKNPITVAESLKLQLQRSKDLVARQWVRSGRLRESWRVPEWNLISMGAGNASPIALGSPSH
jgi:hypothetical protein